MSDEIMNTQPGQVGELSGNAVQQNATGFQQASNVLPNQSPEISWEERERQILAKAYQQTQSLISKSENRQTSNIQGMIDQFKRDYGVTLTEKQAQEMAQNQAAKSLQNAPVQAQAPVQEAPAVDPSYQGFLYYYGVKNDNPVFRQAFEFQKSIGVQLEKTDPEFVKFSNPEKKYNAQEFVKAWKQACIEKAVRLQNAQKTENSEQQNTNLGQMPLVGSRGRKANTYDSKRSSKSYFSEYLSEKKL